jgi:hypothetical protein
VVTDLYIQHLEQKNRHLRAENQALRKALQATRAALGVIKVLNAVTRNLEREIQEWQDPNP